jgi:diadenosine tetraphosphate (Ap4A) HIT family hydrolase
MCIFCEKIENKTGIIFENDKVIALFDNYPVSNGHILIITKRHVSTYFEADIAEKMAIDQAIMAMKSKIDKEFAPDGYNIGINNGIASGQTIDHLHVHLIPRYFGDVDNPRGGVRGVIPKKQSY